MSPTMFRPALFALAMLGVVTAPGDAQNYREQDTVMRAVETGNLLPYPRVIQEARRAVPGGTVIGADFDQESGTYRVKIMLRGAVTWVDVDGHSGQVLNVEGR